MFNFLQTLCHDPKKPRALNLLLLVGCLGFSLANAQDVNQSDPGSVADPAEQTASDLPETKPSVSAELASEPVDKDLPPDAEVATPEQVSNRSIEENIEFGIEILEAGSRRPLADVNAYLLPEGKKATSNASGIARFTTTPIEDASLVVTLSGYQRLELPVNVGSISGKTRKVYLRPLDENVYETVVSYERTKRDAAKTTLGQDEFIKAIGARGDPILALQNQAGVGNNAFGSELIIQGADPEDTRYTINGHEVPLIFHFLGFSSVVIPEVVKSVDYYAAGFGPEFGRAIGGTVGLNTKDPKSDRLHVMAYADLLNSGALVEGPLSENQSFFLGARYSYLGFVLDLVASGDENTVFRQAPQFFDVEGNYTYKISSRSTFDITGIVARDTLKLFTRDADDPFLKGDFAIGTRFFRVIPRYRLSLSERTDFEASIGFGRDRLAFSVGNQFTDFRSWILSFRSEVRHQAHPRWEFFAGTDILTTVAELGIDFPASFFSEERTNRGNPLATSERLLSSIRSTDLAIGAYLRNRIALDADRKWIFQPNLRFDHFTLSGGTHAQPRGELLYQLNDVWRLKAASGIYYQAPTLIQIDPSIGNGRLKDEHAIHYVLGTGFDFRSAANFGFWGEVDAFYKDLNNLVAPSRNILVNGSTLVPERYNNQGSGWIAGSQWTLNYQSKRWTTGLAYTLSWSKRKDPIDGSTPSLNDQRHNINLRAGYKLGAWTFSTRVRFITGTPNTPVVGATYDSDNDIYNPIQGAELSERLPNFLQIDVRADRKWVFKTWILTLYVDIQNVTNRNNINEIDYNFDYSEPQSEAGIPILPTFGVKGEF